MLQKREYKCFKEQVKREFSGVEVKMRVDAFLKEQQHNLEKQQHTNDESYRLEIRKFRRRKLIQYHRHERDMLREELDKRQSQLGQAHEMLIKHHDMTKDLEYSQQQAIHRLRDEQIRKQHNIELANQNEYSSKRLNELRKKHALEVKQQPKSLKQKEMQIRKQFRETCKTQTLQVCGLAPCLCVFVQSF